MSYRCVYHNAQCPGGCAEMGWCWQEGPPWTNDAERDEHFTPLNDRIWGAGNWVRCSICPVDERKEQPYHHKDYHGFCPECDMPLPGPHLGTCSRNSFVRGRWQ